QAADRGPSRSGRGRSQSWRGTASCCRSRVREPGPSRAFLGRGRGRRRLDRVRYLLEERTRVRGVRTVRCEHQVALEVRLRELELLILLREHDRAEEAHVRVLRIHLYRAIEPGARLVEELSRLVRR